MISDVDYSILMTKLSALEHRVKKLEEGGQLKHTPYQSDDPDAPYYRPIYESWNAKDSCTKTTKCAFESADRNKPMGLFCGCSKCSACSVCTNPVVINNTVSIKVPSTNAVVNQEPYIKYEDIFGVL